MKATWERAAEKRQTSLALVREQVDSGSLVTAPMTEQERRRFRPGPTRPKPGDRR